MDSCPQTPRPTTYLLNYSFNTLHKINYYRLSHYKLLQIPSKSIPTLYIKGSPFNSLSLRLFQQSLTKPVAINRCGIPSD